MPCRLLACLLSSLCARGATGNGPTDQCWRRQAEARRRLCVLSAWCLCASEEKRTRVAGIYSCITLLGIASPPGSWRLGSLPEMRRLSTTARSFVPFYAQRISHNIVMHGAQGILDGISRARNKQLRAATGAA